MSLGMGKVSASIPDRDAMKQASDLNEGLGSIDSTASTPKGNSHPFPKGDAFWLLLKV